MKRREFIGLSAAAIAAGKLVPLLTQTTAVAASDVVLLEQGPIAKAKLFRHGQVTRIVHGTYGSEISIEFTKPYDGARYFRGERLHVTADEPGYFTPFKAGDFVSVEWSAQGWPGEIEHRKA